MLPKMLTSRTQCRYESPRAALKHQYYRRYQLGDIDVQRTAPPIHRGGRTPNTIYDNVGGAYRRVIVSSNRKIVDVHVRWCLDDEAWRRDLVKIVHRNHNRCLVLGAFFQKAHDKRFRGEILKGIVEACAFGTALLAGIGIGAYGSFSAAAEIDRSVFGQVFEPDPRRHRKYREKHAAHRELRAFGPGVRTRRSGPAFEFSIRRRSRPH